MINAAMPSPTNTINNSPNKPHVTIIPVDIVPISIIVMNGLRNRVTAVPALLDYPVGASQDGIRYGDS